jgi:hypothetical protein
MDRRGSFSPLLELPRELRDNVYFFLFSSTRLTYGKTVKPARHALSMLLTCRQIYDEAAPLWLGQVRFNFESAEAMLDKLSLRTPALLAQLRHLRVRGDTLMLSFYSDNIYYRLPWAMKLLPNLHLTQLVVLASVYPPGNYDTLTQLIRHGSGWKQLLFIAPNSDFLTFRANERVTVDTYWRQPQPSAWNNELLLRDGAQSGSSVQLYRAT